jgi:hypothetical protein
MTIRLFGTMAIILLSLSAVKAQNGAPAYTAESIELYDEIVHMDSVWEDAYNHCKKDVLEGLISEDLEFFHDQSGLQTSKKQVSIAFVNNICGQVTRELLKGSIEVYRIKDYGAVEMGYHRFHNINDTGDGNNAKYARFVHIWHRENGQWKITRVISLHA